MDFSPGGPSFSPGPLAFGSHSTPLDVFGQPGFHGQNVPHLSQRIAYPHALHGQLQFSSSHHFHGTSLDFYGGHSRSNHDQYYTPHQPIHPSSHQDSSGMVLGGGRELVTSHQSVHPSLHQDSSGMVLGGGREPVRPGNHPHHSLILVTSLGRKFHSVIHMAVTHGWRARRQERGSLYLPLCRSHS